MNSSSAAYRDGWERTFGPKPDPYMEKIREALRKHDEWMRDYSEKWIHSLNRDSFRDNYDAIDWSK